MSEIEVAEVVEHPQRKTHADIVRANKDVALELLANMSGRAIEVISEIMELGDNDGVRLKAAESVLDRTGVQAPQEVHVTATSEEHSIARTEAEQVLADWHRNAASQAETAAAVERDLETVIIHEGDVTESGAA